MITHQPRNYCAQICDDHYSFSVLMKVRVENLCTPISDIFRGHLRSRVQRAGDQSTDMFSHSLPYNLILRWVEIWNF